MSKKNIGIIIQARTGSTRLPGKILLPVHKKSTTFLDLLLLRLTTELPDIPVVVATTTNSDDDIIVKHAEAAGVKAFRGSEKDVLERYTTCANEHGFKVVIRVCGDNPYLDIDLLKDLIDKYDGEDYVTYTHNGQPTILSHYGFFAEIISIGALEKVMLLGGTCREHVTNCIYKNPNIFKITYKPIKIENQKIRCTLDTQSDFETLEFIYKNWYLKNEDTRCPHQELIAFVETKDTILMKMNNQILINGK